MIISIVSVLAVAALLGVFTHVFTQTAQTPEETLSDGGVTTTGETTTAYNGTVSAYGGSAITPDIAFIAANFKSMILLSTVPCVVTLTTATAIDGVSIGTITLVANVIRRVSAITGNVTAVSVSANTTVDGAAGTIKISVIYDS
jgi:hypothetical protein